MSYSNEEHKLREELMDSIERYTGTLDTLNWSEISTDDLHSLVLAVQYGRV